MIHTYLIPCHCEKYSCLLKFFSHCIYPFSVILYGNSKEKKCCADESVSNAKLDGSEYSYRGQET